MLTRFEAEGLRLTKREVPAEGLTYIISIPVTEETPASELHISPLADGDPGSLLDLTA